jgi:hypothetical protein
VGLVEKARKQEVLFSLPRDKELVSHKPRRTSASR